MKGYVAYKLPDTDEVTIQTGIASSYRDLSEIIETNSFIFNAFNNQTNYQLNNLKDCQLNEIKIYYNTDDNYVTPHKEYITICSDLIDFLNHNELDKVILSRLKKVDTNFNPIELFKILNKIYTNTFNCLISIEGVGTWIGSTPELLLSSNEDRFKTVSIAGTKRSEVAKWGEKELEEQQIVTDYISKTLQNNSISFLKSDTKTIKAGHVFHLQTKFEGEINNNLSHLIKALHPTPATCGLPKLEAKSHIESIEQHDRKFYTGFLGPTSKTNSKLFVNLRCLEIQKQHSFLYLGGGITAQSIAEDEWNETENKANTLLEAISLLS